MKIKRISCDQFAGIRNRNVEFGENLNIIYGANESGKSTLIDLARILLFQPDKINRQKKQDKEFERDYFPADTTGPYRGDSIDGTLEFSTENGTYVLSKEWNRTGGQFKLVTPDGKIVRTPSGIEEILNRELKYGAGIFRDIIFAPQRFQGEALENLLKDDMDKKRTEKDDVKSDIRASVTVTQAVMETGGVTLDELERKLEEKLKLYSERWDMDADLPEQGKKRGLDHMWDVGKGYENGDFSKAVILRRYYALEQKKRESAAAREAEDTYEKASRAFREAERKKTQAREERERFQDCYHLLCMKEGMEQALSFNKKKLAEMQEAQVVWPAASENLGRARELKAELAAAKIRRKYERTAACRERLAAIEREIREKGDIRREDRERVDTMRRERERLEGKLLGLNLSAKIRVCPGADVRVLSGITGAPLDISAGTFDIRESVVVSVPEVMELELSPKGIDLETVKAQIREKKAAEEAAFAGYHVENMEEFLDHYRVCAEKRTELERAKQELQSLLRTEERTGTENWEKLEAKYQDVGPDGRPVSEVEEKIGNLCQGAELEGYIGRWSGRLQDFEEKYGTPERLMKESAKVERELADSKQKLAALADIPEEFLHIADIEAEKGRREQEEKNRETAAADCLEALRQAELGLAEKTSEELAEELIQVQAEFEEAKREYGHWLHIRQVFEDVRGRCLKNPMKDIEGSLGKYLRLFGDGGLELGSMNDKMDVNIVSHGNVMIYPLLSEGTKDTVYLAFRLAVLEHLYPDGNGLAVFDDPFTDMDEARRAQACRLIQEFAQKNQVLFATCDQRYRELLDGKWIEL